MVVHFELKSWSLLYSPTPWTNKEMKTEAKVRNIFSSYRKKSSKCRVNGSFYAGKNEPGAKAPRKKKRQSAYTSLDSDDSSVGTIEKSESADEKKNHKNEITSLNSNENGDGTQKFNAKKVNSVPFLKRLPKHAE